MALIFEPRVRETSSTTLTTDFTLTGAMRGSLAFGDVMATGDTCYYVASYGDSFEEALGTMAADGKLTRPATTLKSLHADGTIDTNKVSFASGVKTIIMTFPATRAAQLPGIIDNAVLYTAQSRSSAEKRQALDNLGLFPTGTKMLFQQTAAPSGWTKDTTHNDKALRIVSGSVVNGGSVAFSTLFGRTATDAYTLLTADIPSHGHTGTTDNGGVDHDHNVPIDGGTNLAGGASRRFSNAASNPYSTSGNSGGASAYLHPHTFTTANAGGGGAHNHGLDMRVQYVDMIIATKD